MTITLLDAFNQNAGLKKALIALVLVLVLNKTRSAISASLYAKKLHKKAQEKRRQRDAQLANEFTAPVEIDEKKKALILNASVTELLDLLNTDQVTSEDILKVYHSRAITHGLRLELIAESNYQEALILARQCDQKRKQTPQENRAALGGLFGIPISIKDSFIQKGLDSTCGQASLVFKPNTKDGEIIAFLKARGAIPFIRSNVPQTLGIIDCINHIWGRGLNPWNHQRSIGGSTGGEGGLIASRCSPIGLGSDALGSVRIPAAFCGVVGFKPTAGRYVLRGHTQTGPYSRSKYSLIMASQGPLARNVDDAVLFTKEMISEEGRVLDPAHPFVAWSEEKYQVQKLRVGYVVTEEFFGASKSCRRAVQESAAALKDLGYTVTEVKLPKFERMVLLMVMITSSEGKGRGIFKSLSGEKPVAEMVPGLKIRTLPDTLKKMIGSVLRLIGQTRLANIVQHALELTTERYHELVGEYFEIRNEIYNFFVENKFDAIITPAMPLPAFKHGFGGDLSLATCYNWPANCANLPAGVLPVTKVQEGEDVYTSEDSIHKDSITKKCQEAIKGSVGMPVNVQVMSLPWEDEKCLAVMKAIESKVQFNELPSL